MNVEALQAALQRAIRLTGDDFHLTLTGTGAYVTHWTRPTADLFEDCPAVASGSIPECLSALDAYVDVLVSQRAKPAAPARPAIVRALDAVFA